MRASVKQSQVQFFIAVRILGSFKVRMNRVWWKFAQFWECRGVKTRKMLTRHSLWPFFGDNKRWLIKFYQVKNVISFSEREKIFLAIFIFLMTTLNCCCFCAQEIPFKVDYRKEKEAKCKSKRVFQPVATAVSRTLALFVSLAAALFLSLLATTYILNLVY